MAKQIHVINGIGTGDHAGDQGVDLYSGVGTFIGGYGHPLLRQRGQSRLVGQVHDWDQSSKWHKVGIVE